MGRSCAPKPERWLRQGRNQPRRRRRLRASRPKPGAAAPPSILFGPTVAGGRILFVFSTRRLPSLELLRHVVLLALDRPKDGDLPRVRFGRRRGRRRNRSWQGRSSRRQGRRVGLKGGGVRLHGRGG